MTLESGLQYSQIESQRFGLCIHRGYFNDIEEGALQSYILNEGVDVLIFRIAAEKQYELAKLNNIALPYLVTDTLVYYRVNLDAYQPNELRNQDIEFEKCQPVHGPIIDRLVQEIFAGYTNHYNSNPYLPKQDILAGYQEWARSYIAADDIGRISWLVRRKGNPIGFATCSWQGAESEGVLYGVISEASGGGIYGDIIRFTQNYFKMQGIRFMKVSTQVQNYAVQKVWNREGFVIDQSFLTIHVNSLLTYSCIEKKCISIPYLGNKDMFTNINDIILPSIELLSGIKGSCKYSLFKQFSSFESGKGYQAMISVPWRGSNNQGKIVAKIIDDSGKLFGVSYYEW